MIPRSQLHRLHFVNKDMLAFLQPCRDSERDQAAALAYYSFHQLQIGTSPPKCQSFTLYSLSTCAQALSHSFIQLALLSVNRPLGYGCGHTSYFQEPAIGHSSEDWAEPHSHLLRVKTGSEPLWMVSEDGRHSGWEERDSGTGCGRGIGGQRLCVTHTKQLTGNQAEKPECQCIIFNWNKRWPPSWPALTSCDQTFAPCRQITLGSQLIIRSLFDNLGGKRVRIVSNLKASWHQVNSFLWKSIAGSYSGPASRLGALPAPGGHCVCVSLPASSETFSPFSRNTNPVFARDHALNVAVVKACSEDSQGLLCLWYDL